VAIGFECMMMDLNLTYASQGRTITIITNMCSHLCGIGECWGTLGGLGASVCQLVCWLGFVDKLGVFHR
jgi:hypothetical protein